MTRERLGDLRRFGAYAVLTLIPVIWLGVLLTRSVESEMRQQALQSAVDQAEAIATKAIEPSLPKPSLEEGIWREESRSALRRTMKSSLDLGEVWVFRVRNLQGTVVFDGARTESGTGKPSVEEEVQEAISTNEPVSLVTTVGSDEGDRGNHDLAHYGQKALEVYVPIHFTSGDTVASADGIVVAPHQRVVVGVAEVYLPYQPIQQQIDESTARLVLMIVAGLAVLWLVLLGIAVSLALRERRHREAAEQRTLHDRLTGLPGRVIFADRVQAALAGGGRTATDVALVLVDLDRFKEVNDTLGPRNGDELLCIVAERLQSALRPGDTVARLAGDEFGLVLPAARAEAVDSILRRVRDVVTQETELGGVAIAIEVSMGYAMWPADADDPEVLQQRAGMALHAAKSARGAIVRYDHGVDSFDPQRLTLLTELRRAISSDELVLHYQPKVDAASGRVVAFEALVRWEHPVRGMLRPDEFIPIAETSGLIVPLTHWVLGSALRQLAEWHETNPELSVAVNISARNLRDDLTSVVLGRLHETGVPASRLVLEITETSFAMDPVLATQLLEALDAAGVRVSLDDFGQGYTSLGSLGRLPVSELKIDRGFVMNMTTSPEDRAIVASVIELGHRLGLKVVAEGVESLEMADTLRVLGCDMMQGFLFSRPVAADQALRVMERLGARL